jgi:hypothetical protein
MPPTIAIIGASTRRHKFGNKAVRAYARQGWQVYPVHPQALSIENWPAFRSIGEVPAPFLDRVSIYLPPEIGIQIIDQVAAKPCGEIWLNPGAGSGELFRRAGALGLKVRLGCSIADIGMNPEELD